MSSIGTTNCEGDKTHMMTEAYLKYWGKTEKCEEGKPPRYHLLVYLCMDVAVVGWSV